MTKRFGKKAVELMGMQKDFIVIGSDSGRIVILEFDLESNSFIKIH